MDWTREDLENKSKRRTYRHHYEHSERFRVFSRSL